MNQLVKKSEIGEEVKLSHIYELAVTQDDTTKR